MVSGDTSRKSAGNRGRPLSLEKRHAILAAAHRRFLETGYQATSMDTIAADAGVSKLTAYNHFGNKAALFAEVIERKCQDMLGAIDFGAADALDARSSLIAAGKAFVGLVTSPDAMGAHTVVVQERDRAPELGPMFYNSAVLNSARRVAALLSELHRRGDIRIGDPEQSARDILSLWRAQPSMHIELGIQRFTDEELDAHVARITDLFVKAWQ